MTRPVQSIVSLRLPLPPSVNKAFTSRTGSHQTAKSAAYNFWLAQVEDIFQGGETLPVLTEGLYCLWIDLPEGMRGDTDNRTKLLSDVLRRPHPRHPDKTLGIVSDDGAMRTHLVDVCAGLPKDECVVTVVHRSEWWDYVRMRIG